jgi:holo-[acyl-carrier protein] synthase
MVLGVGTDLMETKRIEVSIERYGERFLERVFTTGEIAYCLRKKKNAAESFAARFAAKEAGAKALGTGISRGVTWKELEVRREANGRPTLHLSGRAAELAGAMGVRRMQLSLTHSRELAMAVVVVED